VLALLTPAAIPGLTLGTVLANAFSISQFGAFGLLDVVFGSLATLLGVAWAWRLRRHTALALAGPVLANALIVPAYLPTMLSQVTGFDFYHVPGLALDPTGTWLTMYLFGVITVGLGEGIVVYGLGWALLAALRRLGVAGGSLAGRA
jgi:uncharacterized membrane protein